MAKTISKLAILVSLSSKGVKTGTSSIGRSLGSMAKKIGPAAVALVGVGTAALVARSAMRNLAAAFSRVDESAKLSRRLNITIASMEALKLAAVEGGSSSGALTSGMERLTRSISEAASGTGEAVDELKELGLSAVSLNEMTGDEQLVAFAKALKGVANESDKTRLLMTLMGRGGGDLKNTLASLAETGMDPLLEKIRELGALSAADAAGIEKMNDSWVELKTAMQGVWNQVAAHVAPVLNDLLVNVLIPMAKWTVKVVKSLRGMMGADMAAMSGLGEEAALSAKAAAAATSKWADEQKRLKEEAAKTAKIQKAIAKDRADALKAAKKELSALDKVKTAVASVATPTLGAVGRGTTAGVAAAATLMQQGRDRAAEAAAARRKDIALAIDRGRILKEIARLTATIAGKPPVTLAMHSVL